MAVLFGYDYAGTGNVELEWALKDLYADCGAIAVPMARVGIYLVLKNLIRKGQKVILSPYTISDVVNMVLCAGGVPLFADIEEGGSFNIDAKKVDELLEANDDVGAVLVTHFYGLVCNIKPILNACAKPRIPVVEDAAQSFGAILDGQRAGSIADTGIFSFGLLKNVTGFLGGAVVTKNSELEAKIREDLRQFQLIPREMLWRKMMSGAAFDIATFPPVFETSVYWMFRYAYLRDLKFFNNKLDTDRNPIAYDTFPDRYAHRMSSAQAKIIKSQFARCQEQSEERIEKARIYDAGLKDLPGLVLPPLRTDGSHIYLYYPIQCDNRDKLARWLTRKLRDVQVSHHRNCASLPCFAAYYRDCPNAERAAQGVIYLPTYPGYKKEQVAANIEAIRSFFREGNLWT
jgi:dTDP-4-amino-4,6-dideoxygalactose transaminase